MNKKIKLLIILLVLVLIYAIGGLVYNLLAKNDKQIEEKTTTEKIDGYNYSLSSNATDLQKSEFEILKKNLESSEVNNLEYPLSVAKLFIIDLYTLDNKINRYDVGGIEYILPEYKEDYRLQAEQTLYKYLEDNKDNKRSQELPIVMSTEVLLQEEHIYKLNNTSYDGYKIKISWEYNKDLGYEQNAELILVNHDNKYYLVEKI